MNKYTKELIKWIEDPEKNKYCYIVLELDDIMIKFTIADVVNFTLNIRQDGSFFISLDEEEELILDEFQDIMNKFCEKEQPNFIQVLDKSTEVYDLVTS